MTYPGPSNEPRKSALSSPAVLIAIIAGLVILIGGVVGAMLWANNQPDDTPQAASSSSSAAPESPRPPDSTVTVTQTPTGRTAPPQSPVPTTMSRPDPAVSGADRQGFGEAGARCNADDAAVFIGYTSRSKVVICQVGSDSTRLYYKGFAGGQGKEISYPNRSGDMFTATAEDGTVYQVSTRALTIVQGGEQVAHEPMVEAWTS